MLWQVEIREKEGIFDAIGEGVKKDILDLGINSVSDVRFIQVYILEGKIPEETFKRICEYLFVDAITQEYRIASLAADPRLPSSELVVEIAYNPGVMDPVEESTLKAIRDLGIDDVKSIKTAKKYIISGSLSRHELETITEKLLYNKLIQHVVKNSARDFKSLEEHSYKFNFVRVGLINASDQDLLKISKDGQLFLNLQEMRVIRDYFTKIGRDPTDCELETIAQTWSEHCGHKTFRGKIAYKEVGPDGKVTNKKIDNLLKSTIMKVTRQLKKIWCVSVFNDNSGIIKFDGKYNVCFKVETHNHPSALEPFGGANTGIGGVIRDPLGTGLGAKPILNTDVFCFAPPNYSFKDVPKGSLHPKRVMKGVVSGVRDYGNKMGIPTVNGAVLFHEKFIGNPLVYCGTAGVLPKNKCFKKVSSKELIVVVGGRTGRDGIHGATFSSGDLTHESEKISSGAVQIGNPIQEKKVTDTILQARDKNLYSAITDCGAGGLSSAVGEMGVETGAKVYLDKVPLKYSGLSYMEIWISESQERMVLSVPKRKIKRLIELFEKENVEAAVIGEFTDTKRLELFYKGNRVCNLEMEFLHEGLPKFEKKALFHIPKVKELKVLEPKDLNQSLFRLLESYDICSKEWIIRQYDHEVQGGSVVKPLTGINNDGPSDAAVVKPFLKSKKGVIVSSGINFRYGLVDPYWMAASCIDEALRQVISVGGTLKTTAILDNFCWGNPDKPDRLGGLVRASFGCYDTALGFGVPFISGKDSLYNEFVVHDKSIAIPGTILISAISVMNDVACAITMDLKRAENLIYIVGLTKEELGGSKYLELLGHDCNNIPKVDAKNAKVLMDKLSSCSEKGLIRSIHDCSEGGLAVSLAEMAFAGGLGAEVFLKEVPFTKKHEKRNDFILFSESNSRFLVEIEPENQKKFESMLKGSVFGHIGSVCSTKRLKIFGVNNGLVIDASLSSLKESWQKTLRW